MSHARRACHNFFFFFGPFKAHLLAHFKHWLTDPKHTSNASLLGLQGKENNNLLLEKMVETKYSLLTMCYDPTMLIMKRKIDNALPKGWS